MRFFALLAALGLAVSTCAEVATYLGVDPAHPLWFLHVGVFVVMVPAMMVQPRALKGDRFSWRAVMSGAPAWMRSLTIFMLLHAVFNGVAFGRVCHGGGPTSEPNGIYALSSHGRIIRHITAAEYWRDRGYEFRGFSGCWMVAYSLALTLLVSQINRRKLARESAPSHPPARGGAVPIWLHQTLLLLFMMFGWVGTPFLTATCILPRLGSLHWILPTVIVIGSAVFGVTVPALLLRRFVPARCEQCGGRMYCQSAIQMNYRCMDCGDVVVGQNN